MKKAILLLAAVLWEESPAQTSAYSFRPDAMTSVSCKMIAESASLADITPDFKKNFVIPYHAMMKLDELFKKTSYPPTLALSAASSKIPAFADYLQFIRVVSTSVIVEKNGQVITLLANGDKLNQDQKNLIADTDPGSVVSMNLGFVYKHDSTSDTIFGKYRFVVVPEQEAQFPGGPDELNRFLDSQFLGRIKPGGASPKYSTVSFLVDETGKVNSPRVTRSSGREDIDRLLKDAVFSMPDWKAATEQGKKVKQQITLSFGYSGGC